jgi:hypothetical protein
LRSVRTASDTPTTYARRQMLEFELRFPPDDIEVLAGRFSYDEDAGCLAAGAAAAARRYYTRDEFLKVCDWKSARSRPLVQSNDAPTVEAATRAAFETSDEGARVGALCGLRGVGVPIASALLHFAFPDRYPILDVRALESLGRKGRSLYPVSFWVAYLDACRRLAAEHGVSLRTLDKALWQHSKENGS